MNARALVARIPKRAKRLALVVAALSALPWLALVVAAALVPLPPALRADAAYEPSSKLLDRHGVVLREVRASDGTRARWVPLSEVGDATKRAMVAAEDRRFREHPGVDPLSIVRAAGQALVERRIVSGASTLTQQLARLVVPRPRTFAGKFREMALALRIEWSLSKDEILEQYLNRAPFGPNLRGIEAASRFYFDKPTGELSLAEAAALASMPRGPSLYDPRRGTERLRRRRDRVLGRMQAAGLATADEVERARREPIVVSEAGGGLAVPHFARALLDGRLDPALGSLAGRTSEIRTTLDAHLQREVEAAARAAVRGLAKRHVGAASVVVVDNATGDLLAYVGSPDVEDAAHLGQNDGVLAARQPGSSLKPFLYELAFERMGLTPASVLPDVELHLADGDGDYHPQNYDGRFHGPVRAREALANSYNVPAVWLAAALGPDRALERLRALGLGTLDQGAAHYGAAIALGDGEVRLLDLANAYATLARGGVARPLRAVLAATDRTGAPLAMPGVEPVRVLDATAVALVTDVLSDASARIGAFGEKNVLELPFPVAVKTGTSKGYRDNVTVGFTPDVTVAVWVGNFDGSPMQGVSGVTGAGPLFRAVMLAAAHGRDAAFGEGDDVESVEVCALSGELPGDACPHRVRERFARGKGPTRSCSMHERAKVDVRNGLRAGPGCPARFVEERTFESFDRRFAAWAVAAGRPLAPTRWSPLCPGASHEAPGSGAGRILFPLDGARFVLDPSLGSRQTLRIRAASDGAARFLIDGRAVAASGHGYLDWPLVAGVHHVAVEGGEDAVEIVVE